MKRSFIAASAYLLLGLLAGLYYRELTVSHNFGEQQDTQLSVLHTHFLVLGFITFLIVIVLDKLFAISQHSMFNVFFGAYNAGLVISSAVMAIHGTFTVLGVEHLKALSGIAGLGHILLALGLTSLLWALGAAIWKPETRRRNS